MLYMAKILEHKKVGPKLDGLMLRISVGGITFLCGNAIMEDEIFKSYPVGSIVPVDLWCRCVHISSLESYQIYRGIEKWDKDESQYALSGKVMEIWFRAEDGIPHEIRMKSKIMLDVIILPAWEDLIPLKPGDILSSDWAEFELYPLRFPPYPKYYPEIYFQGAKHLGDMDELMAKYGDIIKHNMETAKRTDREDMFRRRA